MATSPARARSRMLLRRDDLSRGHVITRRPSRAAQKGAWRGSGRGHNHIAVERAEEGSFISQLVDQRLTKSREAMVSPKTLNAKERWDRVVSESRIWAEWRASQCLLRVITPVQKRASFRAKLPLSNARGNDFFPKRARSERVPRHGSDELRVFHRRELKSEPGSHRPIDTDDTSANRGRMTCVSSVLFVKSVL